MISTIAGSGCFIKGTLVLTPSGQIPIESISIGSEVVSFDDLGNLFTSIVTHTSEHQNELVYKYTLWGGSSITATPNHWVLTSENNFLPIGGLDESICLVNSTGFLVPIIDITEVEYTTVYNFIVDSKYHTYIANNIKVHNGGGGKSRAPVTLANTLVSTATARVVDLICEGPIEGLVSTPFVNTGNNLVDNLTNKFLRLYAGFDGNAKSIFLNDVPLLNKDNTRNFEDYSFQFRNGEKDQNPVSLAGFDRVESEVAVNQEVTFHNSREVVISSSTAEQVRIKIGVPALVEYKADGSVVGSSVTYKVYLKKSTEPSFVELFERVLEGKNTSLYQHSSMVDLNRTPGLAIPEQYTIRVERVTPDSTDDRIQNSIYFDSYTQISHTKLRYQNCAYCAASIPSEQFSSIPKRGYLVKLLKVKIPTGYNPLTREYPTVWDGTFESSLKWTDNPAWCFYDLITNDRYGLGEFIDSSLVDKWTLYTIAKYCDELVPSGFFEDDGITPVMEARFSINTYIQTREDAITLLNNMASVFRGMVYVTSGLITASQDAPKNNMVNSQFTNSNVIDGEFSYHGASRRAIHTTALVSWVDPQGLYTEKIEYVEDADAIEEYGFNPTEVIAFGCTSRGQAHRLGKWLLYTERVESSVVSFKAALDAIYCRPGDIVRIQDESQVKLPFGGRILQVINSTTIKLDRLIEFIPGDYGFIRISQDSKEASSVHPGMVNHTSSLLQSKETVEFAITAVQDYTQTGSGESLRYSTDTIVVGVAIHNSVVPGTMWSIRTNELSEKLYRIISISESEPGIFALSGILHHPGKFAFIEQDIQLDTRVYTSVNRVPVKISETNIELTYGVSIDATGTSRYYLNLNFLPSLYAASYTIELEEDGGWETRYTMIAKTNFVISDISPGKVYRVRITPYNAMGMSGPSTTTGEVIPLVSSLKPHVVQNITNIFREADNLVSWDRNIEPNFSFYKLYRYDHSTASFGLQLDGVVESSYIDSIKIEGTYSYIVDAVNTNGVDSTPAPVILRSSDNTVYSYAHNLSNGDIITFASIDTTTSILIHIPYYVISATIDTFQLSTSLGGSVVSLNLDGSATVLPTTLTVTIAAPAEVHNIVTPLEAIDNITLEWNIFDTVEDLSVAGVEVYHSTTNDFATSTLLAFVPKVLSYYRDTDLASGITKYYWFKVRSFHTNSLGAPLLSQLKSTNTALLGVSASTRNPYKGEWTIDTEYKVGDLVTMDGVTWVCKLAHTSTGSILLPVLPSPSNSYWSIRSVSGDSVDIIFIRSSTQPLTPEDSLGLPLGWSTDVEGAAPGSGTVHTLWSSIGTKNSAEGLYTWNTPVQVEGQSIAEVTVYTRGVPTSTPTGGTYRFDATPGIEVLPTSSGATWYASIPAGSTPLYVSKAVVSAYGNNGEAPITGWTVPVISMRDGEGYILVVESSNGNVFKTGETQITTLSATLFKNGTDITSLIDSSRFKWTRKSREDNATPNDATWNNLPLTVNKTISLSSSEVLHSATFFCEVEEE